GALASDRQGALAAAEGILVAGERVFELKPLLADRSLAAGVEIARVAGAPDSMPPSASGFRLPGFGAIGAATGSGREAAARVDGGGSIDAGPARSPLGSGFAGLGLAALFAAIGGLILNLMP